MLHIIWRDVNGRADVAETTAFADAARRPADRCCGRETARVGRCERRRTDRAQTRPSRSNLVVIALGKLGAGELNLSSDVDLIFAYAEEGETRHRRADESAVLPAARPEADSACSMRSPWTDSCFASTCGCVRTATAARWCCTSTRSNATTKSRVATGSAMRGSARGLAPATCASGRRLIDELKPFVFRRYLDFGAIQSLREMKSAHRCRAQPQRDARRRQARSRRHSRSRVHRADASADLGRPADPRCNAAASSRRCRRSRNYKLMSRELKPINWRPRIGSCATSNTGCRRSATSRRNCCRAMRSTRRASPTAWVIADYCAVWQRARTNSARIRRAAFEAVMHAPIRRSVGTHWQSAWLRDDRRRWPPNSSAAGFGEADEVAALIDRLCTTRDRPSGRRREPRAPRRADPATAGCGCSRRRAARPYAGAAGAVARSDRAPLCVLHVAARKSGGVAAAGRDLRRQPLARR